MIRISVCSWLTTSFLYCLFTLFFFFFFWTRKWSTRDFPISPGLFSELTFLLSHFWRHYRMVRLPFPPFFFQAPITMRSFLFLQYGLCYLLYFSVLQNCNIAVVINLVPSMAMRLLSFYHTLQRPKMFNLFWLIPLFVDSNLSLRCSYIPCSNSHIRFAFSCLSCAESVLFHTKPHLTPWDSWHLVL